MGSWCYFEVEMVTKYVGMVCLLAFDYAPVNLINCSLAFIIGTRGINYAITIEVRFVTGAAAAVDAAQDDVLLSLEEDCFDILRFQGSLLKSPAAAAAEEKRDIDYRDAGRERKKGQTKAKLRASKASGRVLETRLLAHGCARVCVRVS